MAMTPVHVNISVDINSGRSTHLAISPVPPGIYTSHEVPVIQAFPSGASKHKLTSNVFHKNHPLVLHQHDCGPGIADEAPPIVGIANAYLPALMAGSSRKVMFGASTVLGNATPLGAAEVPRFPMLTCGHPTVSPTVYPETNTGNTVLFGLTPQDVQEGWEDITDALLVDIMMTIATMAGFPAPEVLDPLGFAGIDPLKNGLNTLVTFKRSVQRSIASGGTRPISFKPEVTGAGGGGGVELKWTPATGEVEVTAEGGKDDKKVSGGSKRGPDGEWRPTGDLASLPPLPDPAPPRVPLDLFD